MYLFVLYFILAFCVILIKSAWVEIPQVPDQNSQFFFGSPRVSFPNSNFPTTTPSNYKILMTTMTTPTTTVEVLTPFVPQKTNIEIEDTIKSPREEVENEFEDPTLIINNTKTEVKDDEVNYAAFVPFLKTIQQTLTTNVKRSFKSKISFLTELRDNLMSNIDERMTNLWKPDDASLEARGHDDDEMDFPSNEGALMTIGFLTFAVFLIKLVLKLIHALKEKHNGMMAMTENTATAYIGRKKRDAQDYYSMQILQMIDEYKFA